MARWNAFRIKYFLFITSIACSVVAYAGVSDDKPVYDTPAAFKQAYQEAQKLSSSGDPYAAAVIFFNIYTAENEFQSLALTGLTQSLNRAGLPNAASYFFIKTLQSGNRPAIQKVLPLLPDMIEETGGDLLRKYLLRYTSESDYDVATRAHFHYFLGKDELLKGDARKALTSLYKVTSGGGVLAQSAYLRGTAHAILGQTDNAVAAFKSCRSMASKAESKSKWAKKEYFDLEARCTAGLARTLYESGKHEDAETVYDEIPKASFVWTDILFEQAWNAYAKGDMNRALGKLVSYRSPLLNFVFNPEIEVLRAQSFLTLCMYEDVNKTVNEFNSKYAGVGSQLKNFLVGQGQNFEAFYGLAKQAFNRKLHTDNLLNKALNRFIRGPYFTSLVAQERNIRREVAKVQQLSNRRGAQKFGAFIEKVLGWRNKSVHLLGGLFVHNSMTDLYHEVLLDFDKMSFIKLEMLKRSKLQLERKQAMTEDEDGVMKKGSSGIDRKDYQYFWTFNGEFWLDELGDYVFALEPMCGS